MTSYPIQHGCWMTRVLNGLAHPPYQSTRCNHHCLLTECSHKTMGWRVCKTIYHFFTLTSLQLHLFAHVYRFSHPTQNSAWFSLDFLPFFFFSFQKPWLPSIRYPKSLLQSLYLRNSIITNNLSSRFWIELFLYFWIFFKYQLQNWSFIVFSRCLQKEGKNDIAVGSNTT